jgi:hypothetical protein
MFCNPASREAGWCFARPPIEAYASAEHIDMSMIMSRKSTCAAAYLD